LLLGSFKNLAGQDVDTSNGRRVMMDRNLTLRCLAATAILAIKLEPHPQAAAVVIESIIDPSVDFTVRSEAANALLLVDAEARESKILPALCKSLGSEDQRTRFAAHDLLQKLDPGINIDLNALFDKPLSIEPKDLKP
jgi:HEAT repeat protein